MIVFRIGKEKRIKAVRQTGNCESLHPLGMKMERIFVVVEVVAFRFMMERISMYVSARSCCFCS